MRLSLEKINLLKSTILSILPNATIYLFGSRVDDNKRGGDIDILILGDRKLNFIEKAQIEKVFFIKFGEQKLDLISFDYNSKDTFKEVALMEAIKL
ncbi:hypothetical protein MNB_SV-9-73 [hydrothermal vent metagenome]|uniref:Polymerase nucleotidyl transferase domain-containing protein n=1 Tax=hydrothermal vent metagenome TaxID=652676 RepID=A0A1W1CFK4_9ZZZZ